MRSRGVVISELDLLSVRGNPYLRGIRRGGQTPAKRGAAQMRMAHGILSVPAPATLGLLQDVPIYSGSIQGELCTPTGAALLKHYVQEFAPMPLSTVLCTPALQAQYVDLEDSPPLDIHLVWKADKEFTEVDAIFVQVVKSYFQKLKEMLDAYLNRS